ncbi:hypothetical protein FBEOM_14317 [Fusarium beomiforme]|uniref:chitin synthase n=1 Tax=Fusarium beomiforme TaxID=44412 RepID=A0A9P5A3X6_9HYPO|nr:hypothetical protein FBEOM_14317 [Fusarium beomiforme]
MDPLSIASGCTGLISTIGTLSLSINTFVRTCREARSDLDRVARELLSLQTVLELIKEDATDEDTIFPNTLAHHVSGIVSNCNSVVIELQDCITKYSGDNRLKTKAGWAINGQGDVAKFRSNLEAHKAALELALDMLALHVTKEIKINTTEIRNDTSAIKDDTAQILEEISRLQARLPKQVGNDYILQNFLEEMTNYTEKALDGASIDGENSSTRALSFAPEEESDRVGLPDSDLESTAKTQPSRQKASPSQKATQQPPPPHLPENRELSEKEDETGVPPEDIYLDDQKKSSVENETSYWKNKEKNWEDRVHQLYLGKAQRLSPSAGPSSSQQTQARITSAIPRAGKLERPSPTAETGGVARQGRHNPDSGKSEVDEEHYATSEETDKNAEVLSETSSLEVAKFGPNYIHLPKFTVAQKTLTCNYLDIETFNGRVVINFPVPESKIDFNALRPEYHIESSYNSYTALTCSATDFLSQKDALRPARFAKPRKIKVVFSIDATVKTSSETFQRQWKFIISAVAGLTRLLEPSEAVVPPWHNIIVLVDVPRFPQLEIDTILTDIGVLPERQDFISRIDGVSLRPPCDTARNEIMGRPVYARLHEYTVPPTLRPLDPWNKDMVGPEPLQVIAVTPLRDTGGRASGLVWGSRDWTEAICNVLEPEFIISLPKDEELKKAMPSAGEFLKSVWTCQKRFDTSKHEKFSQCIFTTPSEFKKHLKMTTRSGGDRGFARRLFRSS